MGRDYQCQHIASIDARIVNARRPAEDEGDPGTSPAIRRELCLTVDAAWVERDAGVTERQADIGADRVDPEADLAHVGRVAMFHDIGDQFLDDDTESGLGIRAAISPVDEIAGMADGIGNRLLVHGQAHLDRNGWMIVFHRAGRYAPAIGMRGSLMRVTLMIAALALAATAAPALANIGRIKIATGVALVERGKAKLPATVGMIVQKGDTLVTGRNGRIGVTFNDDTRMAAGANARVNLTDYAFDDTTHKGQSLTRVDRGSLAIVSGKMAKANRDAMRVKTPTSLLGVRGTRFVVDVK